MRIGEIQDREYDAYYARYIDQLLPDINLRDGFERGATATLHFFDDVPLDKLDYRYANGKWSIKEVFQHLVDTERIFIYRCFRIARNDPTPLAGFDQNNFIEPSGASNKSWRDLTLEYTTTRNASVALLNSLSNDDLQNVGSANGSAISARAAAAVIIGHDIWHTKIITERYLYDK